jgi:hypothetical protein
MDLGPPDVSTLPVLTLEVSLEEECHIYIPRDNKPIGPQPFLDHLLKHIQKPLEAVLGHLGPGWVNEAGNRTSPNIGHHQTRS